MSIIPPAGALPGFLPLDYTRSCLSNGLDVIIATKPALPIFDMQLIVRGGGAIDPVDHAGRASMCAEMLDEGTTERSALQISEAVEQMGADLDLRAGWDAVFFSLHGLSTRFDDGCALVAELALQPSFPEDEFERKHEERLHALAQERDEPRIVAVKALARAIFGADHPFGLPLGGTTETVQRLDVAATRAYYATTFAPARSHLVVVSNLDPAVVITALEARFGRWQDQSAAPAAAPPVARAERAVFMVDKPGAAQSEVRFGHVGAGRGTADYFPLIVMNTILGGSFKSRLNMKLREEKGFTYGASSFFSFRHAGGAFGGGAAVDTAATGETITLSIAEIERMARGGVTNEELARARNYLSLGFMRNFETTSDIAGYLAEVALYDLPNDYLSSYAQEVARVTAADVMRVAQQYLLPEQLAVVVVGDAQQVVPQLEHRALAPVHHWDIM